MPQQTNQDLDRWIGRTLIGGGGEKIGTIEDIYLDDETGRPEWLAVSTGLFGTRVSFAPMGDAREEGEDVRIGFSKDQVKDAPNAEADGHLSESEEATLYQHYGMSYDGAAGDGNARRTEGRDTSGPTTDDAMTRSEEELSVGTQQRESGRARLRKYVVTEHVQTTVPVQHEEVRLEREPITDGNVDQAVDGPAISEEEHEVVLHEEEAVVSKRTVPKERVRLGTETITDQEQVEADVRKEQIDLDADDRVESRR